MNNIKSIDKSCGIKNLTSDPLLSNCTVRLSATFPSLHIHIFKPQDFCLIDHFSPEGSPFDTVA